MDVGDAHVIAGEEPEQHLGEVAPGRAIEPAHDAEVDGDEVAGGIDEQISRVQIGVKEAVAKHLVEDRAGRLFDNRVEVVAGGDQRLALVDGDALDAFEGQHAAGGAPPIDLGNAEALVSGKILAQLRGRRRLEAQVHLDRHRLGQRPHHLDRPQPPPRRLQTLDQPGQPVEEVEVAGEGLRDARAQHLDRHLAALAGGGKVDLGDRGGGDGLVVEAAEQRIDRRAELVLDGGAGLRRGKRRQPVLEVREVARHGLADQVGAGRQRLAEFDEARPERLQRRRPGRLPRRPTP